MFFPDDSERLVRAYGGHPDPYFVRKPYLLLDGQWEFSITPEEKMPLAYPKEIRVPYAPECKRSGLGIIIRKGSFLHYRKEVIVPKEWAGRRGLLKFMAVDQIADVYWNGAKVRHHEGGYFPFSAQVPFFSRRNVLEVVARDDVQDPRFYRGKQWVRPGGIYYRETSGIWQSVILELLPEGPFVKAIQVEPVYDQRSVNVFLDAVEEPLEDAWAECFLDGRKVGEASFDENLGARIDLRYEFYPWCSENPAVYELLIHYGEDLVQSSFLFRKVERSRGKEGPVLLLNGTPQYLSLVLDQGYHGEGGMTATMEEMADDLLLAKRAGFQGVRKHMKIEPPVFYHMAARLGLAVMQDVPAGGEAIPFVRNSLLGLLGGDRDDVANPRLGRRSASGRAAFERDLDLYLGLTRRYGAILVHVLFNEGWGQFDTKRLTSHMAQRSPGFLIESASGWFDKGSGDIRGYHHYFGYPVPKKGERLIAISEFGGVGYFRPMHLAVWRPVFTGKGLVRAIGRVFGHIRRDIERAGAALSVYTQLADVEDETNGIADEGRSECRFPLEDLRKLNQSLKDAYRKRFSKEGEE